MPAKFEIVVVDGGSTGAAPQSQGTGGAPSPQQPGAAPPQQPTGAPAQQHPISAASRPRRGIDGGDSGTLAVGKLIKAIEELMAMFGAGGLVSVAQRFHHFAADAYQTAQKLVAPHASAVGGAVRRAVGSVVSGTAQSVAPPAIPLTPAMGGGGGAGAAAAFRGAAGGAAAGGAAAGVTALGVAAGGAAIAIGAVAVSAYALKKFFDFVEAETARLAPYSGVISEAQARSQIREELQTIRAAQRMGPDLARAEETRSRIMTELADAAVEIKLLLLRSMEPIAQKLENLIEAMKDLRGYSAASADIPAIIRAAWAASKDGKGRDDWREFMLHGLTMFYMKKLETEEAEKDKGSLEDPFFTELESHLSIFGSRFDVEAIKPLGPPPHRIPVKVTDDDRAGFPPMP